MELIKKVYIAGKITGLEREKYLANFKEIEVALNEREFVAINPTCLPVGLEHHEYMHICYGMIDIADAVYFQENWMSSPGAVMEYEYAKAQGKEMFFNCLEEIGHGQHNLRQLRLPNL